MLFLHCINASYPHGYCVFIEIIIPQNICETQVSSLASSPPFDKVELDCDSGVFYLHSVKADAWLRENPVKSRDFGILLGVFAWKCVRFSWVFREMGAIRTKPVFMRVCGVRDGKNEWFWAWFAFVEWILARSERFGRMAKSLALRVFLRSYIRVFSRSKIRVVSEKKWLRPAWFRDFPPRCKLSPHARKRDYHWVFRHGVFSFMTLKNRRGVRLLWRVKSCENVPAAKKSRAVFLYSDYGKCVPTLCTKNQNGGH